MPGAEILARQHRRADAAADRDMMKTVVKEYDAPTAASASSPTRFPTMMESAIL